MKRMIADISTYRKPLDTIVTQHIFEGHENFYYNYNFFLTQLILPLMIFYKFIQFDFVENLFILYSSNLVSDTVAFISIGDLLMYPKKQTRSKYLFLVAIIFTAIAIAMFQYIAVICITTIRLSALFQSRLYCNAINSHRHRKFFRRKFNETKSLFSSFNVIVKSNT